MFYAHGDQARLTATRELFETITKPLLEETIKITDTVLNTAISKECTINEILLTGAASRMPQIRNSLLERYKAKVTICDPARAVVIGAVLYANRDSLVNA